MKWLADLMKKCAPLNIEVNRVTQDMIKENQGSPFGELLMNSPLHGAGPALGTQGDNPIKLLFVCAEIPYEGAAAELLKLVPSDVSCVMVQGLKGNTIMEFKLRLAQAGAIWISIIPQDPKRHVMIDVKGQIETTDPIWAELQDLMRKDGYARSWEIIVNGDGKIVFDVKMAEEREKHQTIRDRPIGQDEMTDLHIMLEAAADSGQFLDMLEGKPFKKQRRSK